MALTTSPLHKDFTQTRIKRDASDFEKVQSNSTTCSPYTACPTLIHIAIGIVTESDVRVSSKKQNVHEKKEEFVSSDKNKAGMIALINTALKCYVVVSPGDGDVDIVKATVERSRYSNTKLIGKDTYMLNLLLHNLEGYNKTLLPI
ncbi:hypothetical protein DPMN_096056 [Dreissena polymorpha]|uniref:Uncharacterized protein n=1 Tax=Dreissena polymorpha TaxID=45954 RepID=A0A9D4R3B5_DREPO|nr:hypothetical protein DPMN_096056 [Dreissena polymorpha]